MALFARDRQVTSIEIGTAVKDAGLTRSAGEKVKHRLLAAGIIVGDPAGYTLTDRGRSEAAAHEESG